MFLILRLGEDRERPGLLRAMATVLPPDAARVLEDVADRIARDVEAKSRTVPRCHEEMLSGIPRLVHFAKQTLWEMVQPYTDHEDFRKDWRPGVA